MKQVTWEQEALTGVTKALSPSSDISSWKELLLWDSVPARRRVERKETVKGLRLWSSAVPGGSTNCTWLCLEAQG